MVDGAAYTCMCNEKYGGLECENERKYVCNSEMYVLNHI